MVWIFILFLVPTVIGGIVTLLEEWEKAKKEKALEAFKRENPVLWQQQELLKLEKERLEAQQKLAQEERNVGIVIGIGKVSGWW